MGAKCETETIMISTNFSFIFYTTRMNAIFNVSVFYLDFCLAWLTIFKVGYLLQKILLLFTSLV